MYATLVPTGIAAGSPEPVSVMVVLDDDPVAEYSIAVSGTKPTHRKGRIDVTGVAVGARIAFLLLPVDVLPVLLIHDRLVPTSAYAPDAIVVPDEQTAALNTASGSSYTYA